MSLLYPFRALRPAPSAAAEVASVPYDVVNTDEARALASGHPLSFLHVTRSEIDLPRETNPYDAKVYEQAVRNFEELKRAAPLVIEDTPSLYFYRLRMGAHEQTGLAGCFSVDEYARGLIKKHEKTRKDKEDDRTRHLVDLRAQTGIVFLTYRASAAIAKLAAKATSGAPLYDVTAPDGVSYTVWRVSGSDVDALVSEFATLPALYIADGHHRAASAARAWETLGKSGKSEGSGESGRFIAVAFPDDHVQILPYNRTVKDLGGKSPHEFISALAAKLPLAPGGPMPARAGDVSMFIGGRWHTITLAPAPHASRADALDVEQLQQQVLGPLLGIGDPRTDKRIEFCGGIRGAAELERLVTSGQAAVAFSLRAVGIDDLMAIADAGGIMPPKSTWFEPKLRDGLLVHLI
jgi:uncharacterized protein (DUF1015 family)